MLLDISGTLASLLATWLFIRINRKAWLVSMLATILNAWLYWQKGIYADMTLESFYFISTGYGWLTWRKPHKNQPGEISNLTGMQWIILGFAVLILFTAIMWVLQRYTSSNIASLDALTTSLSLVAQWLMCYKITATWILWLITDAIYAYLYLVKELPFHVVLMCAYLAMAAAGYRIWVKRQKQILSLTPTEPLTYFS
ncbi:nicotinamide riboside transporter PnuC [Legionella spiritensis]|uniref:Nicotinamide riboside transporter PnuC n=1 Tax=Legionella spiritensis TaxID=452 RepID=A0A0W0Z6Y7_LEGSP|nr:nicotinamide riboside transporter PnuC [Legionella spiritensis]KTD64877.1 Nicotinamide mononucleotide transporter [Legionella spiritensis]